MYYKLSLQEFIVWLAEPGGMCFLVCVFLSIIALWRVFKKAGLPGWKSVIPIYSSYLLYKICWRPYVFWILSILFINLSLLNSYLSPYNPDTVLSVFFVILLLLVAIITIIFAFHLSTAFGHGIGFTIGLILFYPIFILILGLGSSEFVENPVTGEKKIS